MDLTKKYIEYMDLPEDQRGTTFDDFFDWVNVPYEQRSDFVIAAILNRVDQMVDQMAHESQNYPWLKMNGVYYYIPNPVKALNYRYFQLEDTEEIFKVTGVQPNVQPMCLEFEKNTDEILFTGPMPMAKRVPAELLRDKGIK